MLVFYGPQPESGMTYGGLKPGGVCPHCKTGTRFTIGTVLNGGVPFDNKVTKFVISYICDVCLGPIPIEWRVDRWQDAANPIVSNPRMVIPVREPFEFAHVPASVRKEIDEALECLSVSAFNGFAAVCRRSVQAICTDLGAGASTKVEKQIKEMIGLTDLGDEWKGIALAIMLTGHDGAHPHLPDVDAERAAVLLSLLRDLTYQLYTRPAR